jgi:type II secretory pathway component PulL
MFQFLRGITLIAALALVLLASAIPTRSQTLDDQERCAAQAEKHFRNGKPTLRRGRARIWFKRSQAITKATTIPKLNNA